MKILKVSQTVVFDAEISAGTYNELCDQHLDDAEALEFLDSKNIWNFERLSAEARKHLHRYYQLINTGKIKGSAEDKKEIYHCIYELGKRTVTDTSIEI